MAQAGLRSGDRVIATVKGAAADDGDWQDVRSFNDLYDAIGQAMLDHEPLQTARHASRESGTRTLTVALDTIDPDDKGNARRLGRACPSRSRGSATSSLEAPHRQRDRGRATWCCRSTASR